MTLQRQTISLPIGTGQADDKARALVEGNELARNMRFSRTGLASKSYPMESVTAGGLPGSSGAVNVATEVDGTVVARTSAGAFTLDTIANVWRRTNESAPVPSAALIDPLIRGGDAVFNVDVAIVQDVMCVVYAKEVRGFTPGTFVSFFDVREGALRLVSGPTQLTGILQGRVRVLGVETGSSTRRFTVVGQTAANQVGYTNYTLSSGTYTFGSVVGLIGAYSQTTLDGHIGCAVDGGSVYIVYPTGASSSICHLLSDAGNASLVDASFALTVVHVDSANNRVICTNTTPNVRLAANDLSGAFSSWTTLGWSITTPERVELARWGGTRTAVLISGTAPTLFSTTALVWGTEVRVYESNGAFAFAFHLANTYIHGTPLYVPSWGESAYFLRPGTEPRHGQVVRMGNNAGGTAPMVRVAATYSNALYEWDAARNMGQAHACFDSGGAIFFGYQVATGPTDIFSEGDVRADLLRVQVVGAPPVRNVSAASTRIFGDGGGVSFAGSNYSAMLTLPRGDTPVLTNIISGGIGTNTVSATNSELFIRFAWVWVDQYGNQHRGAPTPFVQDNAAPTTGGVKLWAVIGDGASRFSRLIAVPLPPLAELTLAQERGGDLYLDVFQAAFDDPTAERLTDRIKPTRNTTWKDAVVVYFTNGQAPDPDLTLNQVSLGVFGILTTSRYAMPWMDTELEPVLPAALLDLTSAQSRLWGLSAQKRNTVMPTKPIAFGVAPEFATELEFIIPSEGGDCVGIAAIDDKIIIFKQRRIFVVAGEPGDSLGEGSTLQPPRMLSGDVGCVTAQSIVEGPFGVAFQSQRGFYVLGRGLDLRFVGDRVQAATVGRFCGTLIPDQSEVRWLGATSAWLGAWAASGAMLVWDFLRDQWSVRECGSETVHSVIGGDIYAAAGTGVTRESRTVWTSASYNQSLKTPWIKLNGVVGFQRAWRATLLAYHFTGHLRIRVFYDYATTSSEEHRWLEADLAALRNSDGRALLSIRPANQKCSAIQFQVDEYLTLGEVIGENPAATPGRGHELVSIDLEIGVKSGTGRRILSADSKR